jgi:hypothetical protein
MAIAWTTVDRLSAFSLKKALFFTTIVVCCCRKAKVVAWPFGAVTT